MSEINRNDKRKYIALLIDSDNFSANYLNVLRDELHEIGDIVVARAFGDFSAINKNQFHDLGILPVLQTPYTQGKNASDIRITIDAMDILRKDKVDCFCLATSDSDFTPLAIRLKEEGMTIIGAGEEKTPKPFRNVCHKFILVDVIYRGIEERKNVNKKAPSKGKTKKPEKKVDSDQIIELVTIIDRIIDSNKDSDGYALFGYVVDLLGKAQTDFSPKNYGATSSLALPFFKDFLAKYYEFASAGTIYRVRKTISR